MDLTRRFLETTDVCRLCLLYLWGHSYEFDHADNWHVIEEFCDVAGGDDDTWYATNIEIADYLHAVRALRFSVDNRTAFNPSATSVWLSVDDAPVEVPAGETVDLTGN
jgi:hypothetical protein